MPNIKLRDGSGVETTYNNVDTITVPLADGTGTYQFGLSDEELAFVGNKNWLLWAPAFPNLEKYKDRITIQPVESSGYYGIFVEEFMRDFPGDGSSIKINFGTAPENTIPILAVAFGSGGSTFTKLPRIIGDLSNVYLNIRFNNYWSGFNDLEYIQSVLESGYGITDRIGVSSGGSLPLMAAFPRDCNYKNPSGILAAIQSLCEHPQSASMDPRYDFDILKRCSYAKYIPVLDSTKTNRAASGSIMSGIDSYDNSGLWNDFIFHTNNGVPHVVNWKNQTINLRYAGWRNNTYSGTLSGWDLANNICNDPAITLELAQERYANLKESDYWWSQSTINITYEGSSTRIAMLFSRYGHDSAVRTINSLPDASAYIATAGGSNSIIFRYYSGAETDQGKCGDLTAEEIAVATAKGWTVSFNNDRQ